MNAVAVGGPWESERPSTEAVPVDGTWEHPGAETDRASTVDTENQSGGGADGESDVVWETICGCPTALPATGIPSGIVTFLGGLGACSAPDRFYRRLIEGVCNTASVAIACVPMPPVPGLDHMGASRRARAQADAAVSDLRARFGASLRVVGAGHSLGARLQAVAASYGLGRDDALVLLSFANGAAGPGSFVDMENIAARARSVAGDALRRAADALGGEIGDSLRRGASEAETGESKFSPGADELIDQVARQWPVPRTLVLGFERDSIDNSETLVKAVRRARNDRALVVRTLPGTHVTPMTPPFGSEAQSTGFEAFDSALRVARDAAETDIESCIATVSAFVQIVCRVDRLPPE